MGHEVIIAKNNVNEKRFNYNLRKAYQYFPARRKEIQRVQKLLEEYRKLHIQRAHNSFEGQDEFFEADNTPAEVTSRINNHEERRLERIQSIKSTLDFHQLLKKLAKDIY